MKKILIASVSSLVIASGAAVPAVAQVYGGYGNVGANVAATTSVSAGSGVGVGVGAGAQTNADVRASVRASLITRAVARADEEIARRVNALNSLSARVNAMARLSADQKASLSSQIKAQIQAMDDLKAKIAADKDDASTSSLKADIQSIAKGYRIFMLVIPQGAIEAAADRILDIGATAAEVGAKFQARITAAQSAGNNNTAAAAAALADFNAKIADANAQAQAAISAVANLKPDNGDQAVMKSNEAALKDGRAKIHATQQDFVAARADARAIVKALASFHVSAQSTTTVSGGASN